MNPIEKRYQVFVSSTYDDLVEERSEVMQALLELNCMPAGMELFPAANDTQWNWIKKVIAESDYYIVIIGGRYGTVSEITGQSYTEMEYRYAVEIGKPVIGFFHENPAKILSGKCEKDSKAIKSLEAFREFVQRRLCKPWSNSSDLGAKVSRSITQLIKQYPAVGWVRGDLIPPESTAEEILKLKKRNEFLEAALEKARTEKPAGTESLASGKDLFQIHFRYRRKEHTGKDVPNPWRSAGEGVHQIEISWDAIFSNLAPVLIKGMLEWEIRHRLNVLIEDCGYSKLEEKHPGNRFDNIEVLEKSMGTILIQLRALKLITTAGKDGSKWALTPYGDNYLTKMLAVHKSSSSQKAEAVKK
jgi:hypothetical protein